MINRLSGILLGSFFILVSLEAQETKIVRDLRGIIEIGARKKILHNWSFEVESGLKMEKNISLIDEFNFDANLSYSPLKYLTSGIGYRITADRNNDKVYEAKHRYHMELGAKGDIERFIFEYRLRYQNMDDNMFYNEIQNENKNILRNRFLISFDIRQSKIIPYVFIELFTWLASDNPLFYSSRTTTGFRYPIGDNGIFRLYFRFDHEMNSDLPYNLYNLGLGYTFKL
jgi:hypothetical protein